MTIMIDNLIKTLLEKKDHDLKSCIGFDGYIDEILRVVKSRENPSDYLLFQTILEFSEFIKASAGRSSDIEIILQEIKLGGNAPIMANAIAELGVETSCIGALGMDEIHSVFKDLSQRCNPISVGEPGYTHAFEFNDGKLMFGQLTTLHNIDWEKIKNQIGLEGITKLFEESSLIGIVNWSSISHMDTILEGILKEVLPSINPTSLKMKHVFFDIADPSRRNREDLLNFLKTLGKFSNFLTVSLGLNEKEARIIYHWLDPKRNSTEDDIMMISHHLFETIDIATLVVHLTDAAIGMNHHEKSKVTGFYVENPKISTGGGDNFNAGFCLGQIRGLSLEQSLIVGNATAAYYIRNGSSPDLEKLIEFIKTIMIPK